MIHELDLVVLTHAIEVHSLKAGDVGAVIHCYADNLGYEVEFVTAEGKTVAALKLTATDIRPISHAEIFHVLEVSSVFA